MNLAREKKAIVVLKLDGNHDWAGRLRNGFW
jgi:hypothetical protein